MHDAIETIERAGYKAHIVPDMDPASPAEWDNVGALAYDIRGAYLNRDDLPSDHYGIGRFTDTCWNCGGTGEVDGDGPPLRCEACDATGYATDGEEIAKRIRGAVVCLPVYAYDGRLGTVLEIADEWESANGWIYATHESVETCIGTDATGDHIVAALESELKTWQQWAQGDVYGVEIYDPAGNMVDSCYGFYGIEYAIEEARGMLDTEEIRTLEANPGLSDIIIN